MKMAEKLTNKEVTEKKMLPLDHKNLLAKYPAINFKNQMKQFLCEAKLQSRNRK